MRVQKIGDLGLSRNTSGPEPDWNRCHRLIAEALSALDVQLGGLCVLTEAGSGYFALTPLIAALGGADAVYVLTRDSPYGRAADIEQTVQALAEEWGVGDRVRFLDGREDPRLDQVDVITNLGFVRPIDADLLARVKSTAAVALMWETWEFRPEDLDLDYCRENEIPVLGTDESHEGLRTMDYIGVCAVKLLLQNEIEILGSRIGVIGGGKFAKSCVSRLEAMGAHVATVTPEEFIHPESTVDRLRPLDAIVVADHESGVRLLGSGGVAPERVLTNGYGPLLVHISGDVDQEALAGSQLRSVPAVVAAARRMSVTTAFVGPKPLVDLHSAGLAVSAALTRARKRGLTAHEAEMEVTSKIGFAQSF